MISYYKILRPNGFVLIKKSEVEIVEYTKAHVDKDSGCLVDDRYYFVLTSGNKIQVSEEEYKEFFNVTDKNPS